MEEEECHRKKRRCSASTSSVGSSSLTDGSSSTPNASSLTAKSRKRKSKQKSRDLPVRSKWREIIGPSREIIPKIRLPTNRVVMQRYDYIRSNTTNNVSTPEYATGLFHEIKPIWKQTTLPILDEKTCVRRLEVLLSSWCKENGRKMVLGSERELKYREMLDSLMSLTYLDLNEVKKYLVSDKIQRTETKDESGSSSLPIHEIEFNFLKDQMKNPQVGTIDNSIDMIHQKKVRDREEREQKKFQKEQKERAESSKQFESVSETQVREMLGEPDTTAEENNNDSLGGTEDPDYVPPQRGKKKKKLDKVMLELPTKDIGKEIGVLTARLKLSNRAVTSLYAKVILSGGGDLNKFVISKSTIHRQRILAEKAAEEKLKIRFEELSAEKPYGILHWDGKQIKFNSGDVEEHLVICFQHVGSDKQPQFLGAPHTVNGKGAAQCEAIIRYVDDGGFEEQIIGHVWDTTASNTGRHIGAAKLLDLALGRASLWLACRRHASERHVVHANTAVCGKTSSPDDPLFKHFKEHFQEIDTADVQYFQLDGDENSPDYKFIEERIMDVKNWAEERCISGSFPREDYRELLELLCHVLGGTIRRKSATKKTTPARIVQFHMEQPGAFHHARFMAKAIYYIKMLMVLPQLKDKMLVTLEQVDQIERMSSFVILLYGQYFLRTAMTAAAPRNDLQFWRNVKRYSCVDKEISEAVEDSIYRQMYYLTEELVVLALCDENTPHAEKDQIVQKLIQSDRPQDFPPKKPDFRVDKLLGKSHNEPCLADFVGSRSWLIFHLLDVEVHWMQFPATEWRNYPEYERFSTLVNKIICVNDVAERNVKNVTDYAEYSKDPERRDRVVLVTNYHREMVNFSNLTKDELKKL